MNLYFLIFRHYMRRSLLEPIGILILTCMPIALIIILGMVFEETMSSGFYYLRRKLA